MVLTTPSNHVVLRDAKRTWNTKSTRPQQGEAVLVHTGLPFSSIALYYANIIDYARCVMAVLALIAIMHYEDWQITIAVLVFGSVLLDWVGT